VEGKKLPHRSQRARTPRWTEWTKSSCDGSAFNLKNLTSPSAREIFTQNSTFVIQTPIVTHYKHQRRTPNGERQTPNAER
jgi:hypothetical protein